MLVAKSPFDDGSVTSICEEGEPRLTQHRDGAGIGTNRTFLEGAEQAGSHGHATGLAVGAEQTQRQRGDDPELERPVGDRLHVAGR